MSFTVSQLTGDRSEQYRQLVAQAEALVAGETDRKGLESIAQAFLNSLD